MIHLPTLEEVRQIPPRDAKRSVHSRRMENRRAMYIGGGGISIPGAAPAPSQVIDISSPFSGIIQSCQVSLGLTYGGLLLASGALPPTVGLAGSTTTSAKPIRVTTGAGALGAATYSLSHDGGSTVAQSGTTDALVPIAALPGLYVAFGSGTYVGDEIYQAVCSAFPDQSGAAKDFSQMTQSKQPLIVPGPNGYAALRFDGVDDTLDCSTLSLPAPNVTPLWRLMTIKMNSWGTNKDIIGGLVASAFVWLQSGSSPNVGLFNGAVVDVSGALAVSSWGACESAFTGSTADYLKMGSGSKVTGASAGTSTSAGGLQLGNFNNTASRFASFDVMDVIHLNNVPSAAQIAAARAAVTAKYGVTVAV